MKDFWKMIISSMLFSLIIAFLSPILAIFIQDIGENKVISVGYAFGTLYMTQAIVSSYFGRLADKYGRRKFLILGNLIYCIVPFSYIFITNIYQVVFIQFIAGIGWGMDNPAYFAMFSEKMKKEKRGFGFGIFNSVNTFASGIGALLGATIAQFLGFKILFIVMGIIQIIQTIIIAMVKEK